MHHVHLSFDVDHLTGQLKRCADAGAGEVVFAGVLPQQRHQFRDVSRGQFLLASEHERRVADKADRQEILQAVIFDDGGLHELGDCHRALDREKQGVAIRLCASRSLRSGDSAGAGYVLDHEGLAETLAELGGHHTRDNIYATPCGIRDNDRHRPRWPGLAAGRCGTEKSCEQQHETNGMSVHNRLSAGSAEMVSKSNGSRFLSRLEPRIGWPVGPNDRWHSTRSGGSRSDNVHHGIFRDPSSIAFSLSPLCLLIRNVVFPYQSCENRN